MKVSPFKPYQWENRLLIIYSTGNQPSFTTQKDSFIEARNSYEARDLLVLQLNDEAIFNTYNKQKLSIDVEAAKAFLSLEAQENFKVFLIGKDGSIKLRSDRPIINEKLFATIDAMPMRQQEMKDE